LAPDYPAAVRGTPCAELCTLVPNFKVCVCLRQKNKFGIFILDRQFKDIWQYAGIHLINTEAAMLEK